MAVVAAAGRAPRSTPARQTVHCGSLFKLLSHLCGTVLRQQVPAAAAVDAVLGTAAPQRRSDDCVQSWGVFASNQHARGCNQLVMLPWSSGFARPRSATPCGFASQVLSNRLHIAISASFVIPTRDPSSRRSRHLVQANFAIRIVYVLCICEWTTISLVTNLACRRR